MKKGQVWVETVIYTLIALVVIGLFVSFAKPKIEEIQDQAIVEQSVGVLENIDGIIIDMLEGGAGNQRLIKIGIKKGTMEIDAEKDQIFFEIEGKYTYTEPGEYIKVGNVLAKTEKSGKFNRVTLMSNYSGVYNLTYNGQEERKLIARAPSPYEILIVNKGGQDLAQIDLKVQ